MYKCLHTSRCFWETVRRSKLFLFARFSFSLYSFFFSFFTCLYFALCLHVFSTLLSLSLCNSRGVSLPFFFIFRLIMYISFAYQVPVYRTARNCERYLKAQSLRRTSYSTTCFRFILSGCVQIKTVIVVP